MLINVASVVRTLWISGYVCSQWY